ncbi:MAG: V-type ATP synthase subunit F [Nitrososphaeria archaeon]
MISIRIALIADFDTVIGFKLAGLKEAYIAENDIQAEKILNRLIDEKDIGIIIITESLANKLRSQIRQFYGKIMPIIVEIPDKLGPSPTIEFIRDLVRRTVGVEVILE